MSPDRESRILIVEDQRVISSVLRTALELLNRGYFIIDVPSGEEALLEIQRIEFDIIVADYRLPGMYGSELIKRVREEHPDIKVIMMTAQPLDQVRPEIKDLNVLKLFAKPIDINEFTDVVSELLDGDVAAAPAVSASKTGPLPEFVEKPVQKRLSKLAIDLGAKAIAFVGHTGKVIFTDGTLDETLRFNELAILLANNFTTTTEISTFLGDGTPVAVHYYGGNGYDIYALPVGEYYFITTVFPGGSQKQMGPVLRYGTQCVTDVLEHISVEEKDGDKPVSGKMEAEEAEQVDQEKEPEDTLDVVEPAKKTVIKKQEEPVEANLADSGPVESLELDDSELEELDLGDLKAGLDEISDLDGFWEDAAEDLDNVRENVLSIDEAREMGLIPDELDEEKE